MAGATGTSGRERVPDDGFYRRVTAAAAVVAALIAAGALAGWWLGVEPLARYRPGTIPTMPLTAVGLLLAAAALALLGAGPAALPGLRSLFGRAAALAVTVLGAATLVAYLAPGLDPGLDRLLFPDAVAAFGGAHPGRPAPGTALALTFLGPALLLVASRGGRAVVAAQLLALLAAVMATVALVGYAYGVRQLLGPVALTPMALPTAVALMFLALGTLAARPGRGLMEPVTAADPGGYTARRLLPAAVLLPVVLGWLRLAGVEAGLFDPASGLSLVVVVVLLALTGLVWWNARALHRLDARRAGAERALAEREERFRSLFEYNPDAIFALDAEGRFTLLNPASERVSGYPPPELLGRPFSPLVVPEDLERAWDAFRGALAGEPQHLEVSIVRKDGRHALLQVTAVPMLVAGTVTGVFGIAEDVTERRAAEAERERLLRELGRQRALFDAVLEQLPVGVSIAEAPSGRGLYHNREAVRLLGHELVAGDDYRRYAAYGAVHRDGTPYAPEEYPTARAVLKGEVVREEEMRYRRPDGTEALFSVSTTPVVDAAGRRIAAVSIFTDIRERKRAEEERERLLAAEHRARAEAERRAREEEALRQAIEAVVASFTIDDVVRAIAANARDATGADGAFVQRIGPENDEVAVVAASGGDVPLVGTRGPYPGSAAAFALENREPLILDRLAGATEPVPDQLRALCPACSALVVPLVDAGEAIGALVLVRGAGRPPFRPDDLGRARTLADLGALAFRRLHLLEDAERRREELERILESRERFVRGFSHDVKNPLGAALGQAELLEDGVLGPLAEEQRAGLARIRRSIAAALELIEAMVELARAEAGRIELDCAPTDVREAVVELAEDYRPRAEAKGLAMVLELPDRLPTLVTDASRVRQVVGNLISNAVKYTDRGGIIVRVRACEGGGAPGPGPWTCVEVADTGPGVPPEMKERIFEEFVRVEGGRGGTGLGLAISRRLARALGGDITLESEPGRGSTFTLWLPGARPHAPPADRREAAD